RGAGGLAHRHALGHRADAGVRVVGGGEAAACDEEVRPLPGQERAIGDAHAAPVGEVLPLRVGAAVVVLDGRAAEPDLVVELPRAQDGLAGEADLALDAARLADPDLDAKAGEVGLLVAGDALAEEARVFERLPAALHLGAGEQLGVRGVDDAAVARL